MGSHWLDQTDQWWGPHHRGMVGQVWSKKIWNANQKPQRLSWFCASSIVWLVDYSRYSQAQAVEGNHKEITDHMILVRCWCTKWSNLAKLVKKMPKNGQIVKSSMTILPSGWRTYHLMESKVHDSKFGDDSAGKNLSHLHGSSSYCWMTGCKL